MPGVSNVSIISSSVLFCHLLIPVILNVKIRYYDKLLPLCLQPIMNDSYGTFVYLHKLPVVQLTE